MDTPQLLRTQSIAETKLGLEAPQDSTPQLLGQMKDLGRKPLRGSRTQCQSVGREMKRQQKPEDSDSRTQLRRCALEAAELAAAL